MEVNRQLISKIRKNLSVKQQLSIYHLLQSKEARVKVKVKI